MLQRHVFGKLKPVIQPPNLIEIQTQSYRDFLQSDVPPGKRDDGKGLQAIFREVFPIESYEGRYVLDFVKYQLGEPKMDVLEALAEGGTYAAPLHATFALKDGEEIREEDVYLGEIPLMTRDGAFVINGAERVIVSQLHRSPGVCSESAVHANGQTLFSVRLIPDRGSWIEIQFDTSDVMWVYMDRRRRRRKFHATTFLRALGYGTDESILKLFYSFRQIELAKPPTVEQLEMYRFKDDVIDVDSQAVLARRYEPVTEAVLKQMAQAGFANVEVVDVTWDEGVLLNTLQADPTRSEEEALRDIYHRLRPGDPATPANAKQLMKRLFFDARRYDLGRVGRHKINQKLKLAGKVPDELRTLHESGVDVVEAIRLLLDIKSGRGSVDDIDHLGSRRIRTAGELLENQCRVGLSRTERLIRERMTLFDPATGVLSPARLVNSKSLAAVVQDFFGRSQLSQFMDQTNPLSGLAHKRRLSALGPGGLSRERAGFEVRDVHSSHYGRICPIETPEGPNIGLISSLGLYARINAFGFIESPYRRVVNGKVTNEVVYMTADREEQYVIAQANSALKENGSFAAERVNARYQTEFLDVATDKVQFMDVSPMQVVSIAAGLIPFLEHDDANRALMGANMMRQAVPLLRTERPFVATGLEDRAASDSCVTVLAEADGVVAYVSATEILVTEDGRLPANRARRARGVQRYTLQKFRRTNAGTCFNQKPVVKTGQKVKQGDVLADGPATRDGELALGKNLLVAFMPWSGYNFEDAILVSERAVRDDVFTSVHVQEFEVGARDTKLGPEEITRDIPNVGEEALKNLGADGVIRIGAEVRPGDILVGKITPKSETELAPEERLLRAIFGEKAADVRDTSLTVPSGVYGTVMDVKVTSQQDARRGPAPAAPASPEDDTSDSVEEHEVTGVDAEAEEDAGEIKPRPATRDVRDVEAERKRKRAELEEQLTTSLSNILLGEKIPLDVLDVETGDTIIPANRKITKTLLARLARAHDHIQIESSPVQQKIEEIIDEFRPRFAELDLQSDSAFGIEAGTGDEEGVVKQVRVYIASKKNLSVGDKLAGRHGNKGVVAQIVPVCDMPFLPDGTPVDIVLNPLGVPSRMNLGQLFETCLGAACKTLGLYAATPVFDGVKEQEIDALIRQARESQQSKYGEQAAACLNEDGKSVVYDGRTGEPFDQRVVVGQIYMLKLHHLVTDKIHARATGPYSLVTQQPLGGKAQYGGQRMGEMEVWALEAYGVAYALQELLTVKSDDVAGRTRIYESIVKGANTLEAGMPESFSVLMNELRGLCLDMKLLGGESHPAPVI
ncbi:MAG: DNA-directed RNA polymerase subunit beta [Kiritimatiellae bacterium]|nr:DNA-directed RNA polymerase subunit beta [Kiritimatiellia bacterium]